MYSVFLNNSPGEPLLVECDDDQLKTYFDLARFEIPTATISTEDPLTSDFVNILYKVNMDSSSKKFGEAKIVPMPPFLVNNPNISIIPARSSSKSPNTPPKQAPISTVNRISQVSVLPVSCENLNTTTLKNTDTKEIQNNCKRIASNPICNRPVKLPKLSITKLPKSHKEKTVNSKLTDKSSKLNHNKNNIIKKTDSSSKLPNINAVSSSLPTSSSGNRIPQESTQPLTKYSTNTDLNCKADSTNIDIEKTQNTSKDFLQFVVEGQLKYNYLINSKDTDPLNELIELRTNSEIFQFTSPKLKSEVLFAVSQVLKKNLSKEALETVHQNSNAIQSENNTTASISEIKDVLPTTSKVSSVNHNNISTSKNQCTNQVSIMSQRMTNNIQQPSISKHPVTAIQMSPNSSKSVNSSIASPKVSQPIKHNDQKQHVSNNQHTSSIKHPMATVTQIQSANKQTVSNHQSKSIISVGQLSSVTKQLINQPQGGKSAVLCQLSQDVVKRCNKCKVSLSSDDDVCTTCRMSSQLKGVTVTRIETPAIGIHVIKDEEKIHIISSDEEENEGEMQATTIEPIISKVESKELIIKHMEKLKLNPKLLEDKLWQKDLGVKDYFKFEQCRSIRIGSFITTPAASGDILICMHGIRMTINNADVKAVTIDVQIENIVKIFGFYGDSGPIIFIYTNYLAAYGIRYLLNMNENNNNYYFDPLSKDIALKKIVWYFNAKRNEIQQLEKLLLKLPKGKYEPLSVYQANEMIMKLVKRDENKKHQVETTVRINDMFENIVMTEDKLDDRIVTPIKICDYKMLNIEEFVNDIIIEFYLNYCYSRKLSIEDKKRTYLFNSFFYTSLAKKIDSQIEIKSKFRHDRVKKWTKNVNIFEKDFIFIPINESFHWFMAVICFPYLTGPVHMEDDTEAKISSDDFDRPCPAPIEQLNEHRDEADGNTEDLWYFDLNYGMRNGVDYETDVRNWKEKNPTSIKQPCILIFDSLNGGTSRAKIVATLREWLVEEYRAKYNGIERDFSINTMKGNLVKVPQQPNFTDCGLFVMHYFEKFFESPIVDYTCPITHLENWFSIDEVTKNCQKRREVQQIILSVMEEQRRTLPPGVNLPIIKFTPNGPQSTSNTSTQQFGFNNRNKNKNHDEAYFNDEDSSDEEMDMNIDDDDDDDDEYLEEENEDNGEYQYNNYNEDYNIDEDEYQDFDHDHDNREYSYEMGQNDDWPEGQQDDNEDFHSENEYDPEDIDQFHSNDNIVVNIDSSIPGSSNHRNRHSNHQHVSTENLRSFRSNHQPHMHHQEDDDYNDDENDGEDDELTNIRKRRRLNHRLL